MKNQKGEVPVGLDRDKRFRAPARRKRIIRKIAKAKGWKSRGDDTYFLFRDRSTISTDETGRIQTSGGTATRMYIKHSLWLYNERT